MLLTRKFDAGFNQNVNQCEWDGIWGNYEYFSAQTGYIHNSAVMIFHYHNTRSDTKVI